MKYKHHSLLPLNAFNKRGSVVGGYGMRLHGDSDDWWSQPEAPQEDPNQNFVTTNNESGAGYYHTPAPAPESTPAAPAPAPEPTPAAPAPAYTPPPAPAPEPTNPYRIETIMTGGGGGNDPTYETVLVTPNGNVPVTQDEYGQYVANVPGFSNGDVSGAGSSDRAGAQIDIPGLEALDKTAAEKAFGTGFGQAVGYDYSLKNSEGDDFQKYDAQGNLTEYLDQHGQWQKASNVNPSGTVFNPSTGGFDTLYSVNGSQGIIGEWVPGMSVYHEDQGGFLGEGGWSRMAGLAAAALSAGVAGGAFSGIGLGASGTAAAANPILTATVQGALTSTAVSGMQGASPADMLKSGVIGAITAGLGSGIAGAGLGPLETIAAKTAVGTGIAAATGQDIEKAIIAGLVSNSLPVILDSVLPAETLSIMNEMPKPLRSVLLSTAGSVLNAGISGQDVSDAAIKGVTNGLINIAKDFGKGLFRDASESELAGTVRDYFKPSATTAGNDYSQDNIMAALTEGYENAPSISGQPQYASATMSDADPVVGGDELTVTAENEPPASEALENVIPQDENTLNLYNEVRQEQGLPPVTLDDAEFINAVNRLNTNNSASSTPSPESTASAVDAFVQAGGDTIAISSGESTQSPEYAVTEAFKAFFGRNPTDAELNRFAPSGGDRLSPQEYLKNVYDYAQEEKLRQAQDVFMEFPTPVPTQQPEVVEPKVVEPEQVKPESQKPVQKTSGGGGGDEGGGGGGEYGAPEAAATQPTDAVQAEAKNIATQGAEAGSYEASDIPIVTQNLTDSSAVLGVSPSEAVESGLVSPDGKLNESVVRQISEQTGLSEEEVLNAVYGAGATAGEGTGAGNGEGTGVGTGTGTGGGNGSGTGTGDGSGDGSGDGYGSGDGSGDGSGSGTGKGAGKGTGKGSGKGTGTKTGVRAGAPSLNLVDILYGKASKFGGEQIKVNEPWRYTNQLVGAPTSSSSESPTISSLIFQQMLDKGYFDVKEGGQPEFLQDNQMQTNAPEGHNPEFFSEGGLQNRYAKGGGDGTSDSVPAMLATGEFVIPSEIVSGLGNGDNEAGANVLDKFMEVIRQHKRSAPPTELPPDSLGPLSYLEKAFKKVEK